jgi:hypothetical protein
MKKYERTKKQKIRSLMVKILAGLLCLLMLSSTFVVLFQGFGNNDHSDHDHSDESFITVS